MWLISEMIRYTIPSFLFPEAALLLVSTKNRDLWEGPAPEVRDSRTSHQIWQIWLAENIQNEYSAHAQKIGPSQRSRFLVLTNRSAASGDENDNALRKCLRFLRDRFVFFLYHSKVWHSNAWGILWETKSWLLNQSEIKKSETRL